MAKLNLQEVQELLQDSRTRGDYIEYLKEWVASETVGEEVEFTGDNVHPLMVGKDATKAKTGFDNAKKAVVKDSNPAVFRVPGGSAVKVIKKNVGSKENKVYKLFLINTALTDGAALAASIGDGDDDEE
jgi:hypothetical protein